jgi:hypothetical protein
MDRDQSTSAGWSVVMRDWASVGRDWEETSTATEQVLGRRGVDYFSLIFFAEEHLPAELVAGVSKEQSEELAARLSEIGAVSQAVPSAAVTGVKHRASEVWASRCTDTYCFTEFEGLITTLAAINARENVTQLRKSRPEWAVWQIERSLNHEHLSGKPSYDECVEEAERTADELRAALSEAYPERGFTVCHDTEIVSFWQTTPDSPQEEYLFVKEQAADRGWCIKCGRMRPLRKSNKVDPRFVKAQWGICEECGAEVMVTEYCKLTFIP